MVDEEFSQNLMQQVHELWINPEVERRREAGRLPDDFAISRAQVVMNLDAPEVRFTKRSRSSRRRSGRGVNEPAVPSPE
jgi:hypothetical protein